MKKMMPGAQVVSEGWPKLGTTDFTSHITKAISAKPDLLVSSVWGGDYVAMYKQALRYDMFKKMKFASTSRSASRRTPSGRTTRKGRSRACTRTTTSTTRRREPWPLNTEFVKKYYDR